MEWSGGHPLPGVWELNKAWTLAKAEKPGELIAADLGLSKDHFAWLSRILYLRVFAGPSETTASRRSTFSSQEEKSLTCRHCFPDISLEWVNRFGRAVAIRLMRGSACRHLWFVRRREAAGRPVRELFLLSCLLCSIVRVTVTCQGAFQMSPSTCQWNSICCGKEALMMLWRWSFGFFYVGFLTRPSPNRRNRRIRCPYPFRLFFLSGSNRRQPKWWKKEFHHSKTSSYVSRVIVKRLSWVELGRERNGNVMWQSHISCFSLLFFPWCSTWVNILRFKIKMASFSKAEAAVRQAQRWAHFF